MGQARAIGFAFAVLLASSGPALAPLHAGFEVARPIAPTPCAASAIALDCAAAARDWLAASFLAQDPLAVPRSGADRDGAPSLVAEHLDDAPQLAQVPEPLPLFGLAFGLAILAAARRAHSG